MDDDCIDESVGQCKGRIEFRQSLSGTGISYPRCDAHWDRRLIIEEELRLRYPSHAPSDFDPLYAGESWDDDF